VRKPTNPVAKALALSKRRASVVPNKKGKGSYEQDKKKLRGRVNIPEDTRQEKG